MKLWSWPAATGFCSTPLLSFPLRGPGAPWGSLGLTQYSLAFKVLASVTTTNLLPGICSARSDGQQLITLLLPGQRPAVCRKCRPAWAGRAGRCLTLGLTPSLSLPPTSTVPHRLLHSCCHPGSPVFMALPVLWPCPLVPRAPLAAQVWGHSLGGCCFKPLTTRN